MNQASAPTRRSLLRSFVAGSALMPAIVGQLMADETSRNQSSSSEDPLAAKKPHHAPRAKRVIFLFMSGGVSHVDSFDPKPRLFADHGKLVALDHPETKGRPGYDKLFLKRPQWQFAKQGQSGTEVSTMFPHIARSVDDIALIRSMHCDHSNHYNATLGMHTGSFNFARPSIGAWMSYGLGTVNRNLPSFMVIAPKMPYAGTQVWASDFLPGSHQGTLVVPGGAGGKGEAIANINRRVGANRLQELELAALNVMNEQHLQERDRDSELAARMIAYETAFGMQTAVPEAFDLSKESDEIHALYGLPRGSTHGFAYQCLIARRLAERGVRFIELIDTGSSGNWDSHGNMMEHAALAKNVDQPIAGLLSDLKRRGMLDDTLVVWTTEFGRTPFNNNADAAGREHHNWAFSSWLAGGGTRGGIVHGETDEYAIKPVKDAVHVNDFHATILHLMGLNHEKLTYRHAGRDYRLTDVAGRVVSNVLA